MSRSPRTSPLKLAAASDECVRHALAAHPHLPEPIRDRLSVDPDILVRIRLVTNRATPEDTRTRLLAALDAEQGTENTWLVG
jgi:hypothetical protein